MNKKPKPQRKKRQKSIDFMMKAIINFPNKFGYEVKTFRLYNSQYGLIYIKEKEILIHSYFNTLSQCIKAEYKRVVLRKKVKGGYYLNQHTLDHDDTRKET